MEQTEKEIIKTTKKLISALDVAYNKPGILFWSGFIRGVGYGLGATVGAALILITLSWLLRQLGGIPTFTGWVNQLNQSLPF